MNQTCIQLQLSHTDKALPSILQLTPIIPPSCISRLVLASISQPRAMTSVSSLSGGEDRHHSSRSHAGRQGSRGMICRLQRLFICFITAGSGCGCEGTVPEDSDEKCLQWIKNKPFRHFSKGSVLLYKLRAWAIAHDPSDACTVLLSFPALHPGQLAIKLIIIITFWR